MKTYQEFLEKDKELKKAKEKLYSELKEKIEFSDFVIACLQTEGWVLAISSISYMPLKYVIKVIDKKGKFTEEDFEEIFYRYF